MTQPKHIQVSSLQKETKEFHFIHRLSTTPHRRQTMSTNMATLFNQLKVHFNQQIQYQFHLENTAVQTYLLRIKKDILVLIHTCGETFRFVLLLKIVDPEFVLSEETLEGFERIDVHMESITEIVFQQLITPYNNHVPYMSDLIVNEARKFIDYHATSPYIPGHQPLQWSWNSHFFNEH